MNQRRALIAALLTGSLVVMVFVSQWPRGGLDADTDTSPLKAAPASPTASATAPAAENPARADALAQLLAELGRHVTARDSRPQEAVLSFKDEAAYRRFLARAGANGLSTLGQLDALRAVRVHYDSLASLRDDLLKNSADYGDVSANAYVHIPDQPAKEDREAIDQVPLHNGTLAFLGVPGDHANWGRGTTIAVLDSGIAPDATFGSGRVSYLDIGLGLLPGNGAEDGHGTAVAALSAGTAPDAAGVAPAAKLLSVRVTGGDGQSDLFTVAQGIVAAVDAGAKIVNLSLGGYSTAPALDAAIDYAEAHGVVLVAAAGNDQAAQLAWPAADPRVVSVGAVDAAGQQVTFSNSGPQLQISAPGYGVQTAWLNGQRVYVDGTSASAPLVSGAIAAVMSENPGLTAAQAWQVVRQTASEAGAPGVDADYGNGILNLGTAMNRNNPAYADTAVASHYYDAASGQMEFVLQNRGASAVSGLTLDIGTNGTTRTAAIPALAPGATYVVKVPIDQATLNATGTQTFSTSLQNPPGVIDQVPANNRKASTLTVPKK